MSGRVVIWNGPVIRDEKGDRLDDRRSRFTETRQFLVVDKANDGVTWKPTSVHSLWNPRSIDA